MTSMEKIQRAGEISVARGCGFALLAIGTVMIGLASHLPDALRAGGILMMASCLVLVLKAWRAPTNPFRRTELWIMLEEDERPPKAVAQGLIGGILRELYFRFAQRFAYGSAGMLTVAIVLEHLRTAAR